MNDPATGAPAHPRARGRVGEDAAAEYLTGLGYQIVERNFQTRQGELDCVARDPNGTLVFVEVKVSFGSSRLCHPFYWVTRAKQRHLVAVARRYCMARNVRGPCRFDVVAIVNGRVEHLRNAFMAG